MRNAFRHLVALAVVALAAAPLRAEAQNLYLKDYQSAGDLGVVADLTSGLEWLRLYNTTGQSYFGLQNAMSGGSLSGWRFATRAEVAELACNSALTCAGTANSMPLAWMLGGSYCAPPVCIPEAEYNAIFWTKDSGDEISWQGPGGSIPVLGKPTYVNKAWLDNPINLGLGYDARYGYTGRSSALVRVTAPEPSSLGLMATGLFAMGALVRRRQRTMSAKVHGRMR